MIHKNNLLSKIPIREGVQLLDTVPGVYEVLQSLLGEGPKAASVLILTTNGLAPRALRVSAECQCNNGL